MSNSELLSKNSSVSENDMNEDENDEYNNNLSDSKF